MDNKISNIIKRLKDVRTHQSELTFQRISEHTKERLQHRTSIDFLKHQIELKDDRIDLLLDMVHRKED